MATIDKSLPNMDPDALGEEIEIEQVKEAEVIDTPEGPVEIDMTEDGGAEVSFDPNATEAESVGHFDNIAEVLEDSVTDPMASELMEKFTNYKEARSEWAESYREGLNLLGFKYVTRTEPFRGASSVTHPVLAEAVTQFQAQAYKELLPADGPVRTQILGATTVEKEEQSKRVKDFMNYQIMDQMKEYEPEFDQMLFYLPLSGSTFKKVYYDDLLGRAVSKFIPSEDLVVPYSATSLEDAEAIIHVIKISENDLRKQQINGFYKDIDLGDPPVQQNALKEKELEVIKILVDNLDTSRSESYGDWRDVGLLLHGITKRKDMLDIWKSFSRKATNYDEKGCDDKWKLWRTNTRKENVLTVKTLHWWVRQDIPIEDYRNIIKDSLYTKIEESLSGDKSTGAHYDVANVISDYYKNEFVCSGLKENFWYYFNEECGGKWVATEIGHELRKRLSSEIVKIYFYYMKKYQSISSTELENIEKIELFRLIENNINIGTFKMDGESMSVDTEEDYQKACRMIETDKQFLKLLHEGFFNVKN